MKRLLILLFISLYSLSKAQTTNSFYSFSTYTSTYQSISGTSVSNGKKWYEAIYKIPIGFIFTLYNDQNDTINISQGMVSYNDINNISTPLTAAFVMYEKLCDRAYIPSTDLQGSPGGVSNISYTTTGTSGNKICKIEVNNGGFYGENNANGTSVSFVNFQIWLYEFNNNIEFRFGNCSVQNQSINYHNSSGFRSGLFDKFARNFGTWNDSYVLNGQFTGPSAMDITQTNTQVQGTIQSGYVYKFTKISTAGLESLSKITDLKLYPNPAKDKLYIANIYSELNNAIIEFYDIAGKQIHAEKLNSQIDLSSFNKGIYLVKIKTEAGQRIFVNKIVVTE